MFYDNESYDLSCDLEIETLLADLPFELLRENIKDQINNPLDYTVNYINTITDKCTVFKSQYKDNEDAIRSVNSSLKEFFEFVLNQIDARFGLCLDLDNLEDEAVIELGESVYNFLILRYKKNITRFFYKYIIKNKKSLVEYYEKLGKKKDVTSISLKKQIKNKDDILLISNLPSVIKYILDLEIDPADFLKYAADDDNFDGIVVKKTVTDGIISGNFISKYFELILDSRNDDVLDEVQTDVKLKLMKKL